MFLSGHSRELWNSVQFVEQVQGQSDVGRMPRGHKLLLDGGDDTFGYVL